MSSRGCRRAIGQGFAALAFALGSPAVLAYAQPDPVDAAHQWLIEALTPQQTALVDADLREAWQGMLEAQSARLKEVLAAWAVQHRRTDPRAEGHDIGERLTLRMINELMRWRLDSGGSAHDDREFRAWSQPRICKTGQEQPRFVELMLLAWQRVPSDQRREHLRVEVERLSRWGQPRGPAPRRPVPSVEESAWRALDAWSNERTPLPAALPPMLAWQVAVDDEKRDVRHAIETRCVLRSWWLSAALQRGAGALPADQALAFRYAFAPDAELWWGVDVVAPGAYPAVAGRLGAQGVVKVDIVTDAQGRRLWTTLAEREVRLPGMGEERPIAFETLFDQAARGQADARTLPRPEPGLLRDGRATHRLPIDFKLQ